MSEDPNELIKRNKEIFERWGFGNAYCKCTRNSNVSARSDCAISYDLGSKPDHIRMCCCRYEDGKQMGCNKATGFYKTSKEMVEAWQNGLIVDLDNDTIQQSKDLDERRMERFPYMIRNHQST